MDNTQMPTHVMVYKPSSDIPVKCKLQYFEPKEGFVSGPYCGSKGVDNFDWFMACARCGNLKCFWKSVHCPLRQDHVTKANWVEAGSRRNESAQRRINQAKEKEVAMNKSKISSKRHRKNWYGDADRPSGYGRGKGKGGKGGRHTVSDTELTAQHAIEESFEESL